MNFDPRYFGLEDVSDDDRQYAGSRYSEVRAALFANAYYVVWGAPGEPPLPTYDVNLGRALHGLVGFRKGWRFQQAARRTIASSADMRWGFEGRGFRRILHPNGVCLMGTWEINDAPEVPEYSGYYKRGSKALIIGRYSTCCTETQRGYNRSLALVGKLYPSTDTEHCELLRTANFITQQDLGGAKTPYINDAEFRNAPDTTPWRRGAGLPVLLVTGLVLLRADKRPTIRQLYPIAELGKPASEPTRSPEFMRLTVAPEQPRIVGDRLDFRDEILSHIYDKGDREPKRALSFHIEVSDEGTTKGWFVQRRLIKNWKRIGRIVFKEAVASYNGDFVLHFQHAPWRNHRNDPSSLARRRGKS